MTGSRAYIPALALFALLPCPAGAQPDPDPLITDRPDFTESPFTVAPGRVQLEMGFTYARDGSGAGRTESFEAPEALFRIGLADRWELRIEAPNFAWTDDDSGDDSGATDFGVGCKFALTAQDGAVPAMAVLATLSFPTGDDAFTQDALVPEFRWAWTYDLPEGWSLAGNLGLALPEDEQDDLYTEFLASVSLGIPLADRWGAYLEYFGFYPAGGATGAENYADAGVTFLLTDDVQLDARVGMGLNGRAEDFFCGAGVAIRF